MALGFCFGEVICFVFALGPHKTIFINKKSRKGLLFTSEALAIDRFWEGSSHIVWFVVPLQSPSGSKATVTQVARVISVGHKTKQIDMNIIERFVVGGGREVEGEHG